MKKEQVVKVKRVVTGQNDGPFSIEKMDSDIAFERLHV